MSYVEELFSLEGKVAAAIGAGGVLAGEMARGLGQAGAKVAVIDLNPESAEKVAESVREVGGGEAMAIQGDATKREDHQRALDEILTKWGRIDILINAPGINSATPFFEISEEEWDKIIAINLKSMFLASQVYGQKMIDQGEGGSIINISSASSGPPLSKVFTYGVSKAGVNNLTQYLSREWAPHNIRVNALAPGFFPAEQNRKILTRERTDSIMGHTPMNRFGDASELIGAVVWLSSEKAASFVTGAVIRVDGGYTAMTI
ncbi:SDR family oxidoreductase [Candidatus Latescibacterota bacterium]